MKPLKPLQLLATEATSQADRNSDPVGPTNAGAALIRVELSSTAGTVAYTPKIQRRAADGSWEDYWSAAADLAADGVAWYWIGPEATAEDGVITEAAQMPLPGTWRFQLAATTADGANNATTEAEAELYI